MQSFQIGNNEKDQRFDKYLKKLLPKAPGSFIYKMLRKKNITLNGRKADGSEKLRQGDEIKLFLSEETFAKFSANLSQNFQKYPYAHLDIIYEDEDLLVINKPAGMLSQKAERGDISANEYIIGYLLKQHTLTESDLRTFRPSVCNRLDRNTSGLLVAGKSLKGLQDMSEQLKERQVAKYYLCLVKGEISAPQSLRGWLKKDEKHNRVIVSWQETPDCKYIETEYVPVEHFTTETPGRFTLLEVHLITGRSHQIRAHLASIGHPVVGDSKYGEKQVNAWFSKELQVHAQLLHAFRMKLKDGREWKAPVNGTFQKVICYFREQNNITESID